MFYHITHQEILFFAPDDRGILFIGSAFLFYMTKKKLKFFLKQFRYKRSDHMHYYRLRDFQEGSKSAKVTWKYLRLTN